jgi:hypothetical protein
MTSPFRGAVASTLLLALPARVLAQTSLSGPIEQATRPVQMDAGSLGLLGAGLVILALSQMLRRRS